MKTVKRKSIGTHFSMCVQPAFIIGTNYEDGTHNFAPITWVSVTSLTLSFIRECITVLEIYSGKSVMFRDEEKCCFILTFYLKNNIINLRVENLRVDIREWFHVLLQRKGTSGFK